MELGKLQKFWLENLRKHPERQTDGMLGFKDDDSYNACCLGELLICDHRLRKKKIPFDNEGHLCDGFEKKDDMYSVLINSYEKYGLNDENGGFRKKGNKLSIPYYDADYESLVAMNDDSITWTEIADFIEENAEYIFTKSV